MCGGVPIIRVLREGLASDRVEALWGIVNGTSNYILSTMTETRRAVRRHPRATRSSSATPRPIRRSTSAAATPRTSSRSSSTCASARSSTSRRSRPTASTTIEPIDLEYARAVRLRDQAARDRARSRRRAIEARVHPALVPANWLLADVAGAKNAVYVQSYALGAVDVLRRRRRHAADRDVGGLRHHRDRPQHLGARAGAARPAATAPSAAPMLPIADVRARYYLRFGVVDQPGVLGQLMTILGAHARVDRAGRAGRRAGAGVGRRADPRGARGRRARRARRDRSRSPSSASRARVIRIAGRPMIHEYRVIFGDTDQMGVVYYANYLRYLRGRARGVLARARPHATRTSRRGASRCRWSRRTALQAAGALRGSARRRHRGHRAARTRRCGSRTSCAAAPI